MAGLTNKQQAFVEAYLANGFNGVKAAREAGYKGTDGTLRVVAHENLTKPNISELVQQRIKDMAMGADEALARLSMQARGDITTFLGLSVDDLKQHPQSHLLHKVKVTRRYIPSFDDEKPGEVEEKIELEAYNAQAAQLAILKEQHLKAGEATEIVDDASLTDDRRVDRIAALLDAARARRAGRDIGKE